jgi:hypothetical protein
VYLPAGELAGALLKRLGKGDGDEETGAKAEEQKPKAEDESVKAESVAESPGTKVCSWWSQQHQL